MKRELIATATFGLEAVVKREIQALGYEIIRSEDGKITFGGDETAIARIRSPIIMIDDKQVFPPPSETFGTLAMKALWNVIRFDGNTDSSFHPPSLVDTRARAVDFLKFFFRRLTDILA